MSAEAVEPHGAPAPASQRRSWLVPALVLVVAAGLLAFLSLGAGAALEAATYGLVLAGAALVWCLRSLLRMAQALGRTDVGTVLDITAADGEDVRQAREERRRVLRAIKELDFDHAMGKISDDDHRQVRSAYQLRAVEVARLLQGGPQARLHPDLERVLGRGPEQAGDGRVCGDCNGRNDTDARFCKHCGAELVA